MKVTGLILVFAVFAMMGCATMGPPQQVDGSLPETRPQLDHFYDGEPLPREQSSMLVGAVAGKQAALFIVKVDERRTERTELIGGSAGAVVLPGTHDVVVRVTDKGRISIPLELKGVTVEANVGYLIGFTVAHPEKYSYPDGNSDIMITITITNLDTKQTIYRKVFDGWGKELAE